MRLLCGAGRLLGALQRLSKTRLVFACLVLTVLFVAVWPRAPRIALHRRDSHESLSLHADCMNWEADQLPAQAPSNGTEKRRARKPKRIKRNSNKICVLVRTYHSQYRLIPGFLATMAHGSIPMKMLYLITDNVSPVQELDAVVDRIAGDVLQCPLFATVLKGVTEKQAKRYKELYLSDPDLVKNCLLGCNDFAYGYTDSALDLIFGKNNEKNIYDCDWLMITNGDNVYATGFTDRLIPYLYGGTDGPADMLGWDFVSRYDNGDWTKEFLRNATFTDEVVAIGPSRPLLAEFRETHIDLGAMVLRVEFFLRQRDARGQPLRFISNAVDQFKNGVLNWTVDKMLDLRMTDGLMARELAARTVKEEQESGCGKNSDLRLRPSERGPRRKFFGAPAKDEEDEDESGNKKKKKPVKKCNYRRKRRAILRQILMIHQ